VPCIPVLRRDILPSSSGLEIIHFRSYSSFIFRFLLVLFLLVRFEVLMIGEDVGACPLCCDYVWTRR
jgi:hypothetical protein